MGDPEAADAESKRWGSDGDFSDPEWNKDRGPRDPSRNYRPVDPSQRGDRGLMIVDCRGPLGPTTNGVNPFLPGDIPPGQEAWGHYGFQMRLLAAEVQGEMNEVVVGEMWGAGLGGMAAGTGTAVRTTGRRIVAGSADDVARAAADDVGTAVYRSVNAAGEVQYVGITNDLARRAAAHMSEKGIDIAPLMKGLSRSDARSVEQALIEIHGLGKNGGTLMNKINSIAPSNPNYADSLRRGSELLESIGYK